MVIGSPPCTNWSQMMALNWGKMDEGEKRRRMAEARLHLEFAVELYKLQMEGGGCLSMSTHGAPNHGWKRWYRGSRRSQV